MLLQTPRDKSAHIGRQLLQYRLCFNFRGEFGKYTRTRSGHQRRRKFRQPIKVFRYCRVQLACHCLQIVTQVQAP